jgi:hypothetical protein
MAELKDVVDWFGLGVHLKLDVAKLKGIEAQNGSGTEECKREMLQVWMDTVGESDWPSIVAALKKIDEADLAEKLNKKYSESFVQVSGAYVPKGYPLTRCMV